MRTARGMGGWLGGAWASLWVPRAHPHKPPFPPRQLVTGYGFVVISADDAADTVSENEFLTPHLVGPVHGDNCQKRHCPPSHALSLARSLLW